MLTMTARERAVSEQVREFRIHLAVEAAVKATEEAAARRAERARIVNETLTRWMAHREEVAA